MNFTVRQLAELVHGVVVGDERMVVQAARILHEAQVGDITFLDNPKLISKLQQSQASAAVVSPRGSGSAGIPLVSRASGA